MKSIFSLSALVAAVVAQTGYTAPGAQTYGALNTPNGDTPVTTGQTTTVSWVNNAAPGATVSLVLCNGPGANCVLQSSAIASNIPADAGTYSWAVPCSLPEGTKSTATGYGMLIIVDGTGEFQYSTQFSVVKGSSCGSSVSSTTSSSMTTSVSTSSSISGKPTSSPTSSGWYTWTTSANSTAPVYTASSSKYSSPAAITTSAMMTSQAATSAKATATNAPSTYTGAAAMPTAFINAAGLIGAAGLAMLAL